MYAVQIEEMRQQCAAYFSRMQRVSIRLGCSFGSQPSGADLAATQYTTVVVGRF